MRFLADESCDFAVVRALRRAGHDVEAIAEIQPRADDRTVIDSALAEGRVLLTEDKDFGRLVYVEGRPSPGVILIRFSAGLRSRLPEAVVDLVQERGDQLSESFAVIGPRRVRISRPPRGSSDRRAIRDDAVDRPSAWRAIQREIEQCRDCCSEWPEDVERPLRVGEIPDPPEHVDVLFVGVAPTRMAGASRGEHFYSDSHDRLRRGLFQVLAGAPFNVPLSNLGLAEGNRAFHQRHYFFVHAAKVRPIRRDAPPGDAIARCAARHFVKELETLNPTKVCFLGATNLRRVVSRLIGRALDGIPEEVRIGNWTGWAVLADQPRRNWLPETRRAFSALCRRAEPSPGQRA
jgi:uracil-DNA glycosylase/predicted nuclease of predicted toxin-antitoxin system